MADVFKRARIEHERLQREEAQRRALHGDGRPILSATLNGHRAVAIGNRLVTVREGIQFHEFLHELLQGELTQEWGLAELQKPEGEQHELIRWRALHIAAILRAQSGDGKPFLVSPVGASVAWFRLGYDLYLIRHNADLEAEILDRMRYGDFQAARYELAVAAAFSNANFDIVYADKHDRSKKRPEFIATHRKTGHRFAVEAKAKQRHGVYGYRSPDSHAAVKGAGLRRLFVQAMKKDAGGLPLLVFIEANLPHVDDPANSAWVREARSMARRYDHAAAKQRNLNCAALFVTNDTCAHDLEGPLPTVGNFWGLCETFKHAQHLLPDANYGDALNLAMARRTRIPHEFPSPPE